MFELTALFMDKRMCVDKRGGSDCNQAHLLVTQVPLTYVRSGSSSRDEGATLHSFNLFLPLYLFPLVPSSSIVFKFELSSGGESPCHIQLKQDHVLL